MSLPPALLQRLAQRGLVQKPKSKEAESTPQPVESEEVIAEDYDEMDAGEAHEQIENPSQYDSDATRKRSNEDNFWRDRMKARMGEATSAAGYKGCPNKYNIWHKCTLYCVNRWVDGRSEPNREYMRRYKRLLRKYPLPKGWVEMYDPGCAVYYFHSASENLVSWLPPTHPKSQVSKSAAYLRRQMEETSGEGGGGGGGSDGEEQPDDDDEEENGETRHQREIDEIINSSMRARSPSKPLLAATDFPSIQETSSAVVGQQRKQKSRDIERTLSRQRRERDRDRDRERDRERSYGHSSASGGRRHGRNESDALDPMDPSAYSDTPRGKWSDGLQTGSSERKKASTTGVDEAGKEKESSDCGVRERDRENNDSDDDNEY